MSLEKILDRIRACGEQQSAELTQKAEADACVLLEQARREADQVYQSACREAQLPAEGECARLLNEARFEASCLLGQVRERFIEDALASLGARLSHVRETDSYAEVLHRHLLEVLPPENGQLPTRERITLEADPRDRDLLDRLLAASSLDLEVRYTLDCLGGLNAVSPDRGSRVVNTLESRLERALPYLRRGLAFQFEERFAPHSLAAEATLEPQSRPAQAADRSAGAGTPA